MDSLQDASPCSAGQWLAALLLSLCCLLTTCLPAAAQSVDFPWPAEDNVVVRQGDTAILSINYNRYFDDKLRYLQQGSSSLMKMAEFSIKVSVTIDTRVQLEARVEFIHHICQGSTRSFYRCYLEDGASKGAWLNRSSIIFAGNDKWSVDPRVSIVSGIKQEYSLQIQNVEVTDDGPYTCSVQTQYNPKTLQMHLIVQVPPKILDISTNCVVNEFSNVTLFCEANGKPEPTITWKHISPSAKDFISEGEYLEISGITRNQAGVYECIANNDVSISDTRTVRITVNYPPAIKEIKSPGMVLGKVGLLRCEAFAVPAAAFEWYKGDKRLASGRQGIHIKNFNTRSILTVTNITEDHYGNYTCVAANKLGTSSASHFLHKLIEPTSFTSQPNPPLTTVPSKEKHGIPGGAEVILSWWYLVMGLSFLVSTY